MNSRPFTSDDYPAIAAVSNAAYPEYPSTAEEAQFHDEHRGEQCKLGRWVVERDGAVVAFGEYGQFQGMYHPRKFWTELTVHPEHQGQGVGTALYQRIFAAVSAFDPLSLRTQLREDMARGLQFAQARGFQEDWRSWESRLAVDSFDFRPFAGLEERLRDQGITIKALPELRDDPEHKQKLHDIYIAVGRDIPSPEPRTPRSYESFVGETFNDPNLLPDGYVVAIHNGAYVGMSNIWASQGNNEITIGVTGVRREYRGRGIALALKLRGVAYACEHGHSIIKTWNDAVNERMLAINTQMGFIRQPAWISLANVLKEET